MAGTGTHLHRLVKQYTGQDFLPGCGCQSLVDKMNSHPPKWSIANLKMIVEQLRAAAQARGWRTRLLVTLPGSNTPLRWLVREAVRLAEKDLADGAQGSV